MLHTLIDALGLLTLSCWLALAATVACAALSRWRAAERRRAYADRVLAAIPEPLDHVS